tara:strand:+ start:877 stop:1047 length:171 start_codon:yes stop_codon:yes gene_type:complete
MFKTILLIGSGVFLGLVLCFLFRKKRRLVDVGSEKYIALALSKTDEIHNFRENRRP